MMSFLNSEGMVISSHKKPNADPIKNMYHLYLLCFCHVIFTRHLFIAVLSSFCTYAVLAGPLGDRFCNPHVVIFLLSKHHHHQYIADETHK
jgi:hypothetical protein